MREKLIELQKDAFLNWKLRGEGRLVAEIADHLIDNGVTIQKWIPVSERLPKLESYKYSVDVLFYEREDGIHVGYACLETGVWKDRYSRDIYADYKVTHWMPLPEPPKGE